MAVARVNTASPLLGRELTPDEEKVFVRLYKDNPSLYDKSNGRWSSTGHRAQSIGEIAQTIGVTRKY